MDNQSKRRSVASLFIEVFLIILLALVLAVSISTKSIAVVRESSTNILLLMLIALPSLSVAYIVREVNVKRANTKDGLSNPHNRRNSAYSLIVAGSGFFLIALATLLYGSQPSQGAVCSGSWSYLALVLPVLAIAAFGTAFFLYSAQAKIWRRLMESLLVSLPLAAITFLIFFAMSFSKCFVF
ncbi:MAG: hypothetical protein ABI221_02000 [Candidatus Saccharimonadales bacterium]